jgi:hypothetical protein
MRYGQTQYVHNQPAQVAYTASTTFRAPRGETVYAGTDPSSYRDVQDKHGFSYRQFENGDLRILVAPKVDGRGYWIPGTRGGVLEGQTLRPGHPLWRRVTGKIGAHPSATPNGVNGYGVPFATALTNILEGFGPEQATSTAGQTTQAAVTALPGIQSAIHQLAHPGTLRALSRERGNILSQMAFASPSKRIVLESRLAGVEYQINLLKGQIEAPVSGAVTPAPSALPWILGAGVLGLGLVLVLGGKRR